MEYLEVENWQLKEFLVVIPGEEAVMIRYLIQKTKKVKIKFNYTKSNYNKTFIIYLQH